MQVFLQLQLRDVTAVSCVLYRFCGVKFVRNIACPAIATFSTTNVLRLKQECAWNNYLRLCAIILSFVTIYSM